MTTINFIKWLRSLSAKLETKLINNVTRKLELCSERTDYECDIANKRLEFADEIHLKMQDRASEKLATNLGLINKKRKAAAEKLELIEKELKG